MTRKKFNVTGMTCSACSAHVEKAVSKVPGVQSVAVSLLTNTMQVQYDEGATNPDAIIAAVVKAGYGALAYEEDYGKEYAREFVDAVKQMEEVTECFNTSGDFDFWIKVFVRNMHHYQDFVLNRLGEMESIGSVHSVFVIGTVKNVHAVPVAP